MRTVLTMLFGAALLAATPCAHAFGGPGRGGPFMRGHGGPGGPGGGPPFRLLVAQMSPDQRAQVRQILRADRVEMRQIVKALHDAHEELADKSLAPGASRPRTSRRRPRRSRRSTSSSSTTASR